MKGGLGDLMQKAQEMQKEMQKAQEDLANTLVTGQSGGGMVTITMKGTHEVTKVELDDVLLSDDKEMLEDLIAAAMNDAVHKISKNSKNSMADMTSGLNLPPGFKLPF